MKEKDKSILAHLFFKLHFVVILILNRVICKPLFYILVSVKLVIRPKAQTTREYVIYDVILLGTQQFSQGPLLRGKCTQHDRVQTN